MVASVTVVCPLEAVTVLGRDWGSGAESWRGLMRGTTEETEARPDSFLDALWSLPWTGRGLSGRLSGVVGCVSEGEGDSRGIVGRPAHCFKSWGESSEARARAAEGARGGGPGPAPNYPEPGCGPRCTSPRGVALILIRKEVKRE